ncbi:MAG: vWA domain-containing protein [Myxococcales bacterium]
MTLINQCLALGATSLFVLALSNCSGRGNDGAEASGIVVASAGAHASGGSPSATGSGGSTVSGSGSSSNGSGAGTGAPLGAGSALQCPGVPLQTDGAAGAADEACAGVSQEAEPVPVDLFIMMDRSISMNEPLANGTGTRWSALRDAVEQFVTKLGTTDIRAGIAFFNRTGARDDSLDCDVGFYAQPQVEIGPLAQVGAALVSAIDRTAPGGLTPTLPALQGALQHARQWATAHPGRATSVVLVTDGFPTQCQSPVSINAIADVAREAHENAPYVRTFVVGLAAGFNLDAIAQAGGTTAAYLVDESNIVESFSHTLSNISDSRLGCSYDIPAPPNGSTLIDDDKVQLVYTPSVGDVEEVPRLLSADACGRNPNGGWYFDDPNQPTKIAVCPCTCARFAAGRVDLKLGCEPYVGLR